MQPGFDDTTWSAGAFGIGFDTAAQDNALALLRTQVPPGTSSTFISPCTWSPRCSVMVVPGTM
jgi:hypothetical protein